MTPRELSSLNRSNIITRRWLATMVDMIVLLVICAFVAQLVSYEGSDLAAVAVLFGVPFLYYVVLETTFGRTVGKLATGLVVIDDHGSVPAVRQVVIRTLTRLLEVNPILLGGIPAGIIADRSQARQRWGDMLAGTYVVFSKDLTRLTEASVA